MNLVNKYPLLSLKVILLDMPQPVWRTVAVRAGTSMRELHHIIQATMPWTTSHLYEFSCQPAGAGEDMRIGDTDLWEEDMLAENDDRLFYVEDVFKSKGDTVIYVYDIGDYWTHEITLVGVDQDPFLLPVIPCILAGEGQCPPEDCGGPSGYSEILDIISTPDHPEYESTQTWLSGMRWKPEKFKVQKMQKLLNRYKENMWRQYME